MMKERKGVTHESELAWELERIEVIKRIIKANTGTDDVRFLRQHSTSREWEITERIQRVFEIEENIVRLRKVLGISVN